MSLNKTQVIEHLLGLCRSDIEKRYGEQALDIHNAKLTFEKNRCVRTLFPKSSCRRCVEACREEAIFLNNGTIGLENIKCTVCGACVSSCPTEAFALQSTLYILLCFNSKNYWKRIKNINRPISQLSLLALKVRKQKNEFPSVV